MAHGDDGYKNGCADEAEDATRSALNLTDIANLSPLRSNKRLSEIALLGRFSDQRHLHRVFMQDV
jgi:hypothetical protein